MSIHRRAARADDNEREIVFALRKAGAVVYQIRQPVDLLGCIRNTFFCMEVKDGRKRPSARRLTDMQRGFFACTEGAPRFKVKTIDEALECLSQVGK